MSASSPTPAERRKAPRVESQLLVKFRAVTDPSGTWHIAPLKDISSDGIRFATEEQCAADTSVELQLLLPTTATPVRVMGRVVWARPAAVAPLIDCGVAFIDIHPAQREDIAHLVTLYRARQQRA